jgi:hypothetical protein
VQQSEFIDQSILDDLAIEEDGIKQLSVIYLWLHIDFGSLWTVGSSIGKVTVDYPDYCRGV